MSEIKIDYDYGNGSKGTITAQVSNGILDNIITSAMQHRFVVKNHWSRLLGNHKNRCGYNPDFVRCLAYGRIKFKPNYQKRISN